MDVAAPDAGSMANNEVIRYLSPILKVDEDHFTVAEVSTEGENIIHKHRNPIKHKPVY